MSSIKAKYMFKPKTRTHSSNHISNHNPMINITEIAKNIELLNNNYFKIEDKQKTLVDNVNSTINHINNIFSSKDFNVNMSIENNYKISQLDLNIDISKYQNIYRSKQYTFLISSILKNIVIVYQNEIIQTIQCPDDTLTQFGITFAVDQDQIIIGAKRNDKGLVYLYQLDAINKQWFKKYIVVLPLPIVDNQTYQLLLDNGSILTNIGSKILLLKLNNGIWEVYNEFLSINSNNNNNEIDNENNNDIVSDKNNDILEMCIQYPCLVYRNNNMIQIYHQNSEQIWEEDHQIHIKNKNIQKMILNNGELYVLYDNCLKIYGLNNGEVKQKIDISNTKNFVIHNETLILLDYVKQPKDIFSDDIIIRPHFLVYKKDDSDKWYMYHDFDMELNFDIKELENIYNFMNIDQTENTDNWIVCLIGQDDNNVIKILNEYTIYKKWNSTMLNGMHQCSMTIIGEFQNVYLQNDYTKILLEFDEELPEMKKDFYINNLCNIDFKLYNKNNRSIINNYHIKNIHFDIKKMSFEIKCSEPDIIKTDTIQLSINISYLL